LAHEHANRILSARLGFSAPIHFRTFPALSWQELRVRSRREAWPIRHGTGQAEDRQRMRDFMGDRFHIETLAQLEPANIKSLPVWIHYHQSFRRDQDLSKTDYGFFAINWDYPLPEIRRAFARWLEERESVRKSKPRVIRKSRGNFKDKLRWLGALRIKNHYRKRDLVDYNDSKLKPDAPYRHYPDLVKKAKKAGHLISEMFPSEKEAAQLAAQPFKEDRVSIPFQQR
jgi:hypothetical protein